MTALIMSKDFAVMKSIRGQLAGYKIFYATSKVDGRAVAQRRQPDVVVIDIRRRGDIDLSLVWWFALKNPGASVVVLTDTPSRKMRDSCFINGAAAFVEMVDLERVGAIVDGIPASDSEQVTQ